MNSPTHARPRPQDEPKIRAIVKRTAGKRNDPITRLMSPGDLGELLKPFVFLDLFEVERSSGHGFPPHPHSGIATLTAFLEGSMTYADTTGKKGSLSTGSIEWMLAGTGVWHAGEPAAGSPMRGYQLWLALPPELEFAPPQSLYLGQHLIQSAGPARVLLGTYEGRSSPVPLQMSVTYLHVRLADGLSWRFQPNAAHEIAWLALNSGKMHVSGAVLERELAIFEDGNGAIEIVAEGAIEFVIGSARRHRYPLVLGHYSVHTSKAALERGERTLAELEHSATVHALVNN